ncbi:MAG TPA: GatB/YqeY domain-containing protein [Anaerolineaceae bacterium]|nr:GatB/YqeY domain-containing protein [Anaerolineaceae bacterium]HPN53293.1 GatB/YqeY domain-containing protein [Anaerolineaceae bacterium]
MEPKQKIETALQDAMRAKDEARKRTLRMVLAAVKLAEVEKHGPIDEAGLLSILQKEVKNRHESIQDAQKAGRPDLLPDLEAEIAILNEYLPKQLSREEVTALAQAAIAEVGAVSPADMGKVMKVLVPRVQSQAPGDLVSQVVRGLLQPKA